MTAGASTPPVRLPDDADFSTRPPRAPDDASEEQLLRGSKVTSFLLLGSVFVVAACGLVYELIAGSLSTYLLGNSITQFSLVIGLFLSAMGLGSFLSRFVQRGLLRTFIAVEIVIGLVGGSSALVLFFSFAALSIYTPLLVVISLAIGALVGLEVPLLVRILRGQLSLKAALGNVLSLDYLGALAASLLFPLVLVPQLGLVRSACLFGLLNVLVALLGIYVFRDQLVRPRLLLGSALLGAGLLTVGLVSAGATTSLLEDMLYDDAVIYAKTTRYQRLVLTRWRNDLRLFIDGNIQFSSADEFRYHEALVHPALSITPSPRRVLLLGGGDGLAAREILKHRAVERIDLVDLDPEMTRIFATIRPLVDLNDGALRDRRVRIHNEDAQKFLERVTQRYDVVVMDLPDPNNESLGKLYSRSFFRLVAKHLSPVGVMVTQATSPYYAPAAYWCIVNTIAAADIASGGPKLKPLPYRASVPSFGEWGFVLAALRPLRAEHVKIDVPTRYLTTELARTLFVLPKDMGPRATAINRLDNQVLVRLYERGYAHHSD
jgi:spermidine synthase